MSPFIGNRYLAYLFSSSFGRSNEEAKIARVRFVLDRTRGSRGGKGAASTDMAELYTSEQGGASRIGLPGLPSGAWNFFEASRSHA